MRSFSLPQERKFGNYLIQFFQGSKNPDDYVIKINGVQVTDETIFDVLHRYSEDKNITVQLLKFIWELGQKESINDENNVYNKIVNLNISDELKVILFAVWHRLIIDDINYPIKKVKKGLNGRRRLLGQIYLLLAKKFNFQLPDYILFLPKEVFKLAFPCGIIETVSTEQWNEVYYTYKRFYEGTQDA